MRALAFLVLFAAVATCLRHDLKIEDDSRHAFFIENFGFVAGGELSMTISNFKMTGITDDTKRAYRAGFLIRKTETDNSEFVEESSTSECLLDKARAEDWTIIHTANWTAFPGGPTPAPVEWMLSIPFGGDGLYNIYFANCEDVSAEVSFRLEMVCFNPGPDYLSAGESNLPSVYFFFGVVFTGMLGVWVFYIRKKGTMVYKIHYLMTVLLVLKCLTMYSESAKFSYMKRTGHGSGWNVVYYIFASLKGTMMFLVIALIGTGWAFIKPYLSDKDKKIFLVVIPLQLIDNIAMIVIEESAPGSRGWITWYDVLRLVDIICCGAILFPIVWSMKHLREAEGADGKAQRNLEKLQLFRQFYILVVAYIYFTRIIVYILNAVLDFRVVWISQFCAELAAVAFYGITGHKFRPVEDNPYLRVSPSDEDDGQELNDVVVRDGENQI